MGVGEGEVAAVMTASPVTLPGYGLAGHVGSGGTATTNPASAVFLVMVTSFSDVILSNLGFRV